MCAVGSKRPTRPTRWAAPGTRSTSTQVIGLASTIRLQQHHPTPYSRGGWGRVQYENSIVSGPPPTARLLGRYPTDFPPPPARGGVGSTGYGGHSVGETPGPIPNPEAKTHSADGTAPGRVWESRTPPDNISHRPRSSQMSGVDAFKGPSSPI